MNCTEARSAMLACELADLSPEGASPLARHIGHCGDCRARAEAIVTHTGTLRMAVAARGRLHVGRSSRRRRAIGALALAAGLILVVALAPRTRRAPAGQRVYPAQGRGAVTIEDSQGRAVTIVEGPNTIAVVFHAPEPHE